MHVVKHEFFGNFKKHLVYRTSLIFIHTYITDYNNIYIMGKFDKIIDVGSTNELSSRA